MSTARDATEAAIATVAPKVTVVGTATMGAGWITLDSMVTIIGALVAIIGGWATWYYKRLSAQRAARQEQREIELHERRLRWLDERIAHAAADITRNEAREAKVLGIEVRATDIQGDDDA